MEQHKRRRGRVWCLLNFIIISGADRFTNMVGSETRTFFVWGTPPQFQLLQRCAKESVHNMLTAKGWTTDNQTQANGDVQSELGANYE